ncbi:TIGR00303 family protein [Methanoplanus sp. FWC-SCC4]|uniref:UPF0284 protein F1737_07630 n=1 Tax=Methanochimaera problematica TaxID=2609417 RepID=A0AA97FBU0_9EURY|nr:TIGR00303 family protein [Methanoplanus sp. FWC-SCC4]WOF16570.1 TIGR00303 family protein [Methanoplanus sp. FWC-SCC4]
MSFLSVVPDISFKKPMAAMVIGNSMLSTVPGVSAAGANPKATLMTPNLDAELIVNGLKKGMDIPLSPRGCATPATITRALLELCNIEPLIVNAGLVNTPKIPCIDVYGRPGGDPRKEDAVPDAHELYQKGITIGKQWNSYSDLLMLGESVPGGTTTALCVLRGLGYDVGVSSSFIKNNSSVKKVICRDVLARIKNDNIKDPLDIVRYAGDPMMPVVAGITKGFKGEIILSGGSQMLAVCAVLKAMNKKMPPLVTTEYVRADTVADIEGAVKEVGAVAWYTDPDFENIGRESLRRYCDGEVKEGALLSGALWLSYMMNYSKEEIWKAILEYLDRFGCK